MEPFEFIDALTGDLITQDYATGEVFVETPEENVEPSKSIFFPGCSMINYAMPLVDAVYKTLLEQQVVDGISVLCCGKILSYEPDGENIRAAFEAELRDHVAAKGIERFVCACPNCVKALRDAFAVDPRTENIELVVLPQAMADLGYRLDKATVATLVKGSPEDDVLLCTHDSCPDREYGDFADGLRAVMPDGLWVDPEHCRRKSICCGSLPRAAGKVKAADKCADTCGREALAAGADAIVTACMSCAFQLNMAQPHVQAVHFLEMLYSWRVNWAAVGYWMKVRFLFNDTLGVTRREGSNRNFAGLGAKNAVTEADRVAAEGVDISNEDVESIGL